MLSHSAELSWAAKLGERSLWVHHYQQPLSHYTVI